MKIFSRLTAFAVSYLVITGLSQAADTYKLDTAHSYMGFAVRHLMISSVKGEFTKFEGTLQVDNGKIVGGEVTIQAESIDTENQKRDDHLRNEDFFKVDTYPTITFKIKNVVERDGKQVLIGDFTIRDKTHTLELPVVVNGPVEVRGSTRIGLEGTATIDRMKYDVDHDPTGTTIGKDVKLDIAAELIKQ